MTNILFVGDLIVPQYAKNPKPNLRKQHETASNTDAASGGDDEAEPTFDNPPEEEAPTEEEKPGEETAQAEEELDDNDTAEKPQNVPDAGSQDESDKEDTPVEVKTDNSESPDKVGVPSNNGK